MNIFVATAAIGLANGLRDAVGDTAQAGTGSIGGGGRTGSAGIGDCGKSGAPDPGSKPRRAPLTDRVIRAAMESDAILTMREQAWRAETVKNSGLWELTHLLGRNPQIARILDLKEQFSF